MSAAAFTETTGVTGVVARRRVSPTVDVVRRPCATLYRNQLPAAVKLTVQLSVPPTATVPLGEHAGVRLPGTTRCVRHRQNAPSPPHCPRSYTSPCMSPWPRSPGSVHSSPCWSCPLLQDGPFTGTTVLESLLLVSTSLLALVVAGTVIDPATVGVKLTVHASAARRDVRARRTLATGAPATRWC